jgi:hypothetical protein
VIEDQRRLLRLGIVRMVKVHFGTSREEQGGYGAQGIEI